MLVFRVARSRITRSGFSFFAISTASAPFTAAERLSGEMPHVPLLLCTLYATKGLAPQAKRAGISGLISKSTGLDGNLTAAIGAVADGKQFFPKSWNDED